MSAKSILFVIRGLREIAAVVILGASVMSAAEMSRMHRGGNVHEIFG